MKTLEEIWPDIKEDTYWFKNGPNGYRDLIDTFGYEVVVEKHEGSYCGDSFYAFKDGNRYGFLSFGWGSCSGCDWFESVVGNLEETRKLQESLFNDIKWFYNKEQLLIWLSDEKVQKGKFYWSESLWHEFRELVKNSPE